MVINSGESNVKTFKHVSHQPIKFTIKDTVFSNRSIHIHKAGRSMKEVTLTLSFTARALTSRRVGTWQVSIKIH